MKMSLRNTGKYFYSNSVVYYGYACFAMEKLLVS